MSLKHTLVSLAKHGRNVWKFFKGDIRIGEAKFLQLNKPFQAVQCTKDVNCAKLALPNWLKFCNRKTFASEVHRRFNERAIPNSRSPGYFYSLLGFGLITQSVNQFEKHNPDEEISLFIQRIVQGSENVTDDNDACHHTIDDYEVGGLIAKGCNGTVYQARYKGAITTTHASSALSKNENLDKVTASPSMSTENDLGSEESFCIISEGECNESTNGHLVETPTVVSTEFSEIVSSAAVDEQKVHDMKYDRALKIMFNYGESNELEIRRQFNKEAMPAHCKDYECFSSNEFLLPPHPNIVDMQCSFTGLFPRDLPDSEQFNMALPQDLGGCGRNHTLFLDMKRYGMTLKEFLKNHHDMYTSMMIISQLLEGIVHLSRHGVAHRDLKTDNILLDIIEDEPHVVISDFGCCMASTTLLLDYPSDHVDKGGNTMLMAPEIKHVKPGRDVQLNYEKSDLWAVGKLAYEIFSASSPLKTSKYSVNDLQQFKAHQMLEKLINAMSRPNPDDRPLPGVAANAAQLILWAPLSWWQKQWSINKNDVVNWIFFELFVQVVWWKINECIYTIEQQLKWSLLSRFNLDSISESMKLLNELSRVDE